MPQSPDQHLNKINFPPPVTSNPTSVSPPPAPIGFGRPIVKKNTTEPPPGFNPQLTLAPPTSQHSRTSFQQQPHQQHNNGFTRLPQTNGHTNSYQNGHQHIPFHDYQRLRPQAAPFLMPQPNQAASFPFSNDYGDFQRQVSSSLIPQSQSDPLTNSKNNGVDTVNKELSSLSIESDSDDDSAPSAIPEHPNKFPVEIEHHSSSTCCYRRQPTRSGQKVKQFTQSVYNPYTGQNESQPQTKRYYQKDLVRMCNCGAYEQADGLFQHGRSNDCAGYEIHYNQKCKWKAYDDFKTGQRVLIRLCKCYKP